jgi:hypothetical protein
VIKYKDKKEKAAMLKDKSKEERADIMKEFRELYGVKSFLPGCTEVENSTLQQRVWEKTARGGSDLLWNDNDPCIYILVTGKAKFSHPAEVEPQPYALAITFSYESEEDIQLRQKLSEQVKIKQREQVRVRTQVQV